MISAGGFGGTGFGGGGTLESIARGIQNMGQFAGDDQRFAAMNQVNSDRSKNETVGLTLKALGTVLQFFPGWGTAAGMAVGAAGQALSSRANAQGQLLGTLASLGPGTGTTGLGPSGGEQVANTAAQGFEQAAPVIKKGLQTSSNSGLPTAYATRDKDGNLIFVDQDGNVLQGPTV